MKFTKRYLSMLKLNVPIRKKRKIMEWLFKNKNLSGPFPLRVQIEATSNCNLSCIQCPREDVKIPPLKFETFELFFKRLEPYVCEMMFHGWGEPMLNKDLFLIMEYVRKNEIEVSLTTNGTLLTKINNRKLMNLKPRVVAISLDAAEKKVYEEIRIGANFDKVIAGIKDLVHIKNIMSRDTIIRLAPTIGGYNLDQIPKLMNLKDELGVDEMLFNVPLSFFDYNNMENLLVLENKENLRKYLELVEPYRKRKDVEIVEKSDKRRCVIPKMEMYLNVLGFVYPCSCASNCLEPLGHILTCNDVTEIYQNRAYQEFREKSLNGEISVCNECYMWGKDWSDI